MNEATPTAHRPPPPLPPRDGWATGCASCASRPGSRRPSSPASGSRRSTSARSSAARRALPRRRWNGLRSASTSIRPSSRCLHRRAGPCRDAAHSGGSFDAGAPLQGRARGVRRREAQSPPRTQPSSRFVPAQVKHGPGCRTDLAAASTSSPKRALAESPAFSDLDRAELVFRLGACRFKVSSTGTAITLRRGAGAGRALRASATFCGPTSSSGASLPPPPARFRGGTRGRGARARAGAGRRRSQHDRQQLLPGLCSSPSAATGSSRAAMPRRPRRSTRSRTTSGRSAGC